MKSLWILLLLAACCTTPSVASPICDGVTDDGPAIQLQVNTTPLGGVVIIPATVSGCLIATTVELPASVQVRGDGLALLDVPNATAFHVTGADVTLTNLRFVGNRSASIANMAVDADAAPRLTMSGIQADKLNTFVTINGGYFHQFSAIRFFNVVRAGFIFDGQAGVNGVEAILSGIEYNTDDDLAQPTIAAIWVKDFDGLVLSSFDLIHAGQVAAVYINPQQRKSSDHLIGLGYLDSTQGACMKIMPEGTAVVSRTFIKGTWFATCNRGLWLTGANTITDVHVDGGLFLNNQAEGYRFDNTDTVQLSTNSVRDSQFAANNGSASGKSDIYIKGTAKQAFTVIANLFNSVLGFASTPLHNIEIIAGTSKARISFNDMAFSVATGAKITGDNGTTIKKANNIES